MIILCRSISFNSTKVQLELREALVNLAEAKFQFH